MSQAIVTESKLTAIGDAIRQQLGTSTPYTLDEMATAIASISGGGGGGDDDKFSVTVLDYDGTILDQVKLNDGDTYTLPTSPVHSGLTFLGWSCTETITSNTITVDKKDVLIGAYYTTTSGLTEIDLVISTSNQGIKLYARNGDTVNWGDGNSDTATSAGYITHTYTNAGSYMLTYNGTRIDCGAYSSSCFLHDSSSNYTDLTCVKAVRISSNVTAVTGYSFYKTPNVKHVILSSGVTDYGVNYLFYNTVCLKAVIFPSGVTKIGGFTNCFSLLYGVIPTTATTAFTQCFSGTNIKYIFPTSLKTFYQQCFSSNTGAEKLILNWSGITLNSDQHFRSCSTLKKVHLKVSIVSSSMFSYCYSLKEITLENTTQLSSSCFDRCFNLEKVTFPASLTYIGSQSFRWCISMEEYDFTNFNSVPTLANINAFDGMSNTCKIYVPDNLYSTWIAASNWSTYASHIYKASERT